jgi:hypothetical protein
MRHLLVVLLLGTSLSACAEVKRFQEADAPISGSRCRPYSPCAPRESSALRQFFDLSRRRYYYYDPPTRRFFWEDGTPRT